MKSFLLTFRVELVTHKQNFEYQHEVLSTRIFFWTKTHTYTERDHLIYMQSDPSYLN